MYRSSMKIIAVAAAAAVALSLGTVSADAKKKKKRPHRHHYTQGFHPNYYPGTNAGYNQCKYDQTRYPALDIRC